MLQVQARLRALPEAQALGDLLRWEDPDSFGVRLRATGLPAAAAGGPSVRRSVADSLRMELGRVIGGVPGAARPPAELRTAGISLSLCGRGPCRDLPAAVALRLDQVLHLVVCPVRLCRCAYM